MDFLILIIIVVIGYLLPELLKRRNPKEYKYPEIPSQDVPTSPPILMTQIGEPLKSKQEIVAPVSTENAYNVNTSAANKNLWQENLDQSMVVNGFIFAEILSPPLAKRPKRNFYTGGDLKNLK